MTETAHVPVLAQEAVAALAIQPGGVYIDATFGRGGHSRLVLDQLGAQGRLIALDRDPDAIRAGANLQDKRLTLVQRTFSSLGTVLAAISASASALRQPSGVCSQPAAIGFRPSVL